MNAPSTSPLPATTTSPWRARPWLALPLAFLLGRLGSIAFLYTVATPTGGRVAENPWESAFPAALAEGGTLLGVAALLGLTWLLGSPRVRRVSWWIAFGALAGSAVLSEIDTHVHRWMGLRLNMVFFRQLMQSAPEPGFWRMLGHYLAGDWFALLLSVVVFSVPITLALRARPPGRLAPRPWVAVLLLVVSALAITDSARRVFSYRKWRLIAPVVFGLGADAWRATFGAPGAPDEAGLAAFKRLTGNPAGTPRHPAWRPHEGDEAVLAAFKARPAAEKPDIYMFAVESLRGWAADFRNPKLGERLPNLVRLFRTRGVAFVHAHSNGYPSNEGNMHLHLGVWSHPSRAIAIEHVAVRTRSLPQILGDAGYSRLWLTGSDPTYDNLQNFVARWFDKWEYKPSSDAALIDRLIQHERLPASGPRFFSVYTASMHPPYDLPPEEGPRPADEEAAYLRAFSYTDRAIGRLLDHLEKEGRLDRSLFIITGDHAQPNEWQRDHSGELGVPNAGRTWTTTLFAGPGLPAGTVREDTASHVDVPPTILGLLNLPVSHHFYGRDLFHDAERPVVAMFSDGLSLTEGADMLVGDLGGDALHKYRYDEGTGQPVAGYKHGHALEVTAADKRAFNEARAAGAVHSWLMDNDALLPPEPKGQDAAKTR